MIKNNKWKLIITSLVILLPMLAGIIFWNKLPQTMSTHWGADGVADGQSGKAMVVFGLPIIMLALHWLCIFFTDRDPGNKHQSKKVFASLYWIVPAISLMSNSVIFLASTGKEVDIAAWICALIGIMFIVFGNYMPKYRRNATLGIKIKWTLASEANWNATHRFAGKLWVAGGIILIACMPVPEKVLILIMLAVLAVLVIVPMLYSWRYYRKQLAEGFVPDKPLYVVERLQKMLTAIMVPAIVIFCVVICFTGNIEVDFSDESFTIKATYYSDLTVEYAAIESVEYRETFDAGLRTNGFGSPRLSMGTFKNDEFGYYTIYAYNSTEPCVVVNTLTSPLVIRGADEAATQALYEQLQNR